MKLAWHSDYGKAFSYFLSIYDFFWIYLLALLGM